MAKFMYNVKYNVLWVYVNAFIGYTVNTSLLG